MFIDLRPPLIDEDLPSFGILRPLQLSAIYAISSKIVNGRLAFTKDHSLSHLSLCLHTHTHICMYTCMYVCIHICVFHILHFSSLRDLLAAQVWSIWYQDSRSASCAKQNRSALGVTDPVAFSNNFQKKVKIIVVTDMIRCLKKWFLSEKKSFKNIIWKKKQTNWFWISEYNRCCYWYSDDLCFTNTRQFYFLATKFWVVKTYPVSSL